MVNRRFVTHDTFVIEKVYDASPTQVFAAWSNPETKKNWYHEAAEFDFRMDGREIMRYERQGRPSFTFIARYQEIVPDQRIVYSYTMDQDDEIRISASLTTVEIKQLEEGTQLIYTEQGAFFDGHDTSAQREHGTEEILDRLGEQLEKISTRS